MSENTKLSTPEEMREMYNTGIIILTKLFQLKTSDLKEKLKGICGNKVPESLFTVTSEVNKTTRNDTPMHIDVYAHPADDRLHVNVLGIRYKSANGSVVQIVTFHKSFTL
jgi:hypothetical protein